MKHLLFSGPQENWEVAIAKETWGVEEGIQPAKQHWAKIKSGDLVFFYATKIGIIGFGILKEPEVSTIQLWKDGDYKCRAPFEIYFHILNGHKKPISISDLNQMVQASMNHVSNATAHEIWKRIKKEWKMNSPTFYQRWTVNVRKSGWYLRFKSGLIYIAGIVTGFLIEKLLSALFEYANHA